MVVLVLFVSPMWTKSRNLFIDPGMHEGFPVKMWGETALIHSGFCHIDAGSSFSTLPRSSRYSSSHRVLVLDASPDFLQGSVSEKIRQCNVGLLLFLKPWESPRMLRIPPGLFAKILLEPRLV